MLPSRSEREKLMHDFLFLSLHTLNNHRICVMNEKARGRGPRMCQNNVPNQCLVPGLKYPLVGDHFGSSIIILFYKPANLLLDLGISPSENQNC